MARLRRKDIKKDEMVTLVNRIAGFLRRYRYRIIATLLAILVAVLGLLTVRGVRARRAAAAVAMLQDAEKLRDRGVGEAAEGEDRFSTDEEKDRAVAEALDEVVRRYPGSGVADKALLSAGSYFFRRGDYAKAKVYFYRYVTEYPDREFAAVAQEGIGFCLEETGVFEEAGKAFAELRDRFPKSHLVQASFLNEGRCLEATGNWVRARELYTALAESHPDHPLANEAKARAEWVRFTCEKGSKTPKP